MKKIHAVWMKPANIRKGPFQAWSSMSLIIKLKICFYLLSIYLHKNRTFNFLSHSIIHLYVLSTTGFSITQSFKKLFCFFLKWKFFWFFWTGNNKSAIHCELKKYSVQPHTTLGTFFEAHNPWHLHQRYMRDI